MQHDHIQVDRPPRTSASSPFESKRSIRLAFGLPVESAAIRPMPQCRESSGRQQSQGEQGRELRATDDSAFRKRLLKRIAATLRVR